MTIMRVPKKQNYLVIDKTFLADVKLSWKAKGLMTYLLSLPDNWRINVSDLMNRSIDGRDSVRTTLRELGKTGYIIKEKRRQVGGKLDYPDYWVYETPQPVEMRSIKPDDFEEGEDASPETALPATDKPAPVNPPLLSNKNTKYEENKIKAAAIIEVDSRSVTQDLNTDVNANSNEIEVEIKTGKQCAAASFSDALKFQESDYRIGNELSEPQKQAIQRIVEELIHDGIAVPTQQAFTHQQIAAMILSHEHFTKAGDEFCKKLNTITRQLRQGTLVFNRVNPIQTPTNPEKTALENELKKLCLAKYSQEQGMKQLIQRLEKEPEKLESYTSGLRAGIAEKTARIEEMRAQLDAFKKTLLGA